MNEPTIALCLTSLAVIGWLPRVFFRPGRLNLHWWITAAPFFFTAGVILLGAAGIVDPAISPSVPLLVMATLLSAASISLIGFTVGTHRQPLSLWHQEDDTPVHVVTWGAYSRVRHPFYSAFLLALLGCVAAFPHHLTVIALVFAAVQLNRTAGKEERLLVASPFGQEYRAYISRTGRFAPRVVGRSSSLARFRTDDRHG